MYIRKAEKSDANRLQQMLYGVQRIHSQGRPDVFKSGTQKYTNEQVEQIISNPQSPVFVVDKEGQVIAYAFCEIKREEQTNNLYAKKTLYVDDFCVDQAVRGNGVGRTLMNYVFDYAKNIQCDRVTLNVWHLNAGAEEFYKKCGMQPLKTVMEMKISND